MREDVSSPIDIDGIFSKPGSVWSEEEYRSFYHWLYEPARLDGLVLFVSRRIPYALEQDAKDVLQDFMDRRLAYVVRKYDPERSGGDFWRYLCFCLGNACFRSGQRLRKRYQTELPLTMIEKSEEEGFWELELTDPSRDPLESLVLKERKEAFDDCFNRLPSIYRTAFKMYDVDGMSGKEMSKKLGISVSNVKMRLRRARLKLIECLKKKGIEEWKL
jgi:RNA polymerase sigma factor (sigma-70 family)